METDDLQRFHTRTSTDDPQYAVARQLLDLGEAVMCLREASRLTRGQLAKRLSVKARDIVILEEETPGAAAGLLDTALGFLVSRQADYF